MDYTVRRAEVDLIALEGHLASLDAVRAQLETRNITQGLALECDALMHANRGQGSLLALAYDRSATSKDYQVALEGVINTVWETIKLVVRKIIEYVKKFWLWITGKSNTVTPEKAEAAEQAASGFEKAFRDWLEQLPHVEVDLQFTKDGKTTTFTNKKDGGATDPEVERLNKQAEASHAEADRLRSQIPEIQRRGDEAVKLVKEHGPEKAAQMIRDGHLVNELKDHVSEAAKDAEHTQNLTDKLKQPHEAIKPLDPSSIKVTRREGATDPKTQFHVNQVNETAARVREQNDKVNEMLDGHPSKTFDLDAGTVRGQGGPVTDALNARKPKIGQTSAKLDPEKHKAESSAHAQQIQSQIDDEQGLLDAANERLSDTRRRKQNGQPMHSMYGGGNDHDHWIGSDEDFVKKSQAKIDGLRAKLGKPATESIATEDAGIGHLKPVDALNATAESMKSQFLSGLPRPEALILFSQSYGSNLEQLAREFSHLKPIEALARRYEQLNELLPKFIAEAAQIDTIKDASERQQRIADFQHRVEKTLESALDREGGKTDDADQLASDIKRFQAARESHGTGDFEIDTPATGDRLMHVAAITDTTFRTVRAVIAEVQSAATELKTLETALEGLSSKIVAISAGSSASATDYVAHALNSEVRFVSMRVRTITQGMAVFTNYYTDAHRAVSRYQKFVIKVVDTALKQMNGEHEFQEDRVRSALAHMRDASRSFDRLAA
jgi:hypothetical protein